MLKDVSDLASQLGLYIGTLKIKKNNNKALKHTTYKRKLQPNYSNKQELSESANSAKAVAL